MSSYRDFYDEVGLLLRNDKDLTVDEARIIMRDRWIDQERYSEFIAYFLQDYGGGHCFDYINPFCSHLLREKRGAFFKKIMKGIIRARLGHLWIEVETLKARQDIDLEELSKIDFSSFNMHHASEYSDTKKAVAFLRDFVLRALKLYKDGLVLLGDNHELLNCNQMIESVETLTKNRVAKAKDKRKIDDVLFWELIEETRKISDDNTDFLDKLQETLESFGKAEIKKFQKLVFLKVSFGQ